MRMHRARACLACVRRPVVGADSSRDARLRQGDARERRVVPLRRTVVRLRSGIASARVAAQIESPVQSAHTVTRVSATRRRPPRMPRSRKLDV